MPGFVMINPFGFVPVERSWHEWTPVPSLGFEVHARTWTFAAEPVTRTPLVLVAGLGVSSTYWLPLGRRLAASFHVLAPDLPGFGGTPRDRTIPWPSGPDVDSQCEHLRAWMDARKLPRVILCGHSTGGQTVTAFAAKYPERVERLVLIAPAFAPGHRTLISFVPRLLACAVFEAPSITPLMAIEYLRTGLPRAVQQGTRFMRDRLEARLPGVTAPTLVIAGEHDLLVPGGWTDTVRSLLPHGTLVTIDQVGHAVQYTAPSVTATVVRAFAAGELDEVMATNPGATPTDKPTARPATARSAAAGTTLAPASDPRHDPLGPPQPIPPTAHGVLDYVLAVAAVIVPAWLKWGPRTRAVLAASAVASTATNLVSDHRAAVTRRVPMVTHADADLLSGVTLLIASRTVLKGESKTARRATTMLGLYQIAAALLTAKPTGPAKNRQRN